MARLRVVLFLGLSLGLLNGCGGGISSGGGTTPPPSTGSLTVTVSSLPSGTAANITVSGPNGYSSSVTSTQTLQVTPGTYTVAAASVSSGNSNYWPAIASQSATVAVSTPASITVNYATIIPKTTKVLDSAGMSSLAVSPGGSALTMSASSAVASSLQPGDILASGPTTAAPNGLLVKIDSASTSGQTITANVEAATLEQAIQQGTLQYTTTLVPSVTSQAIWGNPRRLARNLGSRHLPTSLVSPASSGSSACPNTSNTFQIPYSVPLVQTSNSTVTLNGENDFCPTLTFQVQISGFKVSSASATATLGVHNSIGVLGTDHGDFNATHEFITLKGAQVTVPVGPIVVVVQPTLTPFIGISGSASASAFAGFTMDSTVSAGIAYNNGIWSTSGNASPTVVQPLTSVDGQMELKAFAGMKAGVLLYGTVTPYLSTDGYLQFNAGLSQDPCWSLTAGVEANVGVSGAVFGQDFDYPSTTLNLYSTPVAQANGTCFAPVLSTTSPTTAQVGSQDLTLALTGSNFVPDSVVNWNGLALTTTFVDTNDLTAVVPASDLMTEGTFPVTVVSPDNPGGISSPLNFTVSDVAIAVSPSQVDIPTGATQQFTSTVSGTSNTGVNWSVNGVLGGNVVVGTITSNGLYTAPVTVPIPAAVKVTAVSQSVSTAHASASVTVISGSYKFTSIDFPGATSTSAEGINNNGQIVGYYLSTAIDQIGSQGFSFTDGKYTSFGYPGPVATAAWGWGINNSGQIVGSLFPVANTLNQQEAGYLLSGGTYSVISYPGSAETNAYGINDSGQIVGAFADSGSASLGYGFLLSHGVYTPFDYPGYFGGTIPNGINDSGQIVGYYYAGSVLGGFLWSGGTWTAINYPGTNLTYPLGINTSGQIVGSVFLPDGTRHGFLLSQGVYTLIDFPGSLGTYLNGINDSGQIVGSYEDSSKNFDHGFLATPVN